MIGPTSSAATAPGRGTLAGVLAAYAALVVGLPFVIGRALQEPQRWFVPHGVALGVLVASIGVALTATYGWYRTARRTAAARPGGTAEPVGPPRAVRLAALRGRPVPEEWAPQVVTWLDRVRVHVPTVLFVSLTQSALQFGSLAMNDYQRARPYLLMLGMFLVLFAVMAVAHGWLGRLRGYYAAAG